MTNNTPRLVTTATGRHIHAVIGTGHSTTLCGRSSAQTAHAINATCRVCARYLAALREPATVYGCEADGCMRPADQGSTLCDVHGVAATPDDVPPLAPASVWCDSATDDAELCSNHADVLTVHGAFCWPHYELALIELASNEDGRA